METLLQPLLQQGPVFTREVQGATIVLVPRAALGNLNEAEIVRETQDLLQVINNSGPTRILIDLNHGDYMGSAFVGAIVRLWKRVGERGGRLAMCNLSDKAYQILRVTKLHAMWPIYATRDEALQAIGR